MIEHCAQQNTQHFECYYNAGIWQITCHRQIVQKQQVEFANKKGRHKDGQRGTLF
jgi:hypothetical protein